MKTAEDLRFFFDTELKKSLQKVESKRKAILTRVTVVIILTLAAIGFTVWFFNYLNDQRVNGTPARDPFELGWLILFILVELVGGFVLSSELMRNKGFYYDFKNLIIEQIMQFIHPSFHYKPHKSIALPRFVESHMFRHLPNKSYKGDDYVSGDLGSIGKLEFSEIEARRKGDDKKSEEEGNIVFKGLFFVAETHNTYKGYTAIVPKSVDLTQATYPDRVKMNRMNSAPQTLQSKFNVFTSDEEGANEVLTNALISRLIKSEQSDGVQLMVSFHGHRIFVGVAHPKDLFEPKLTKSLMDFEVIKEFFDELAGAISVVEAACGETIQAPAKRRAA